MLSSGIRIYIYPFELEINGMDARLLDVVIGVSGFLVLIVLLAILPMIIVSGVAYLGAIMTFILFLSGAGYLVNEKII
jgi:hypothetical protein